MVIGAHRTDAKQNMVFTPITERSPVQPFDFAPPPGSTRTVLVAGASGRLGRHVARELKQRGYRVRALSRDPLRLATLAGEIDVASRGDVTEPETLVGACAGTDVIISCVGASLLPGSQEQLPRFAEIDLRGTANLLRIAREAEVSRFICIAPFAPDRLRGTDYGEAREEMVGLVAESGLPYTVIRPTMMFGICSAVLPLVWRERRWLLGNAKAELNPIDERDVAELCVGAISAEVEEIEAGGPESLSQRELALQMLESLDSGSPVRAIPPWVCRGAAALIRPFRARDASLLELAAAFLERDVIAPPLGRRRWQEYLANASGALRTRISRGSPQKIIR